MLTCVDGHTTKDGRVGTNLLSRMVATQLSANERHPQTGDIRESLRARALVILAGAALVLTVAFLLALLQGDIPEPFGSLPGELAELVRQQGAWAALALLYLEESGVPMPVPGDVFVMYLGHRASGNIAVWLGVWLALVTVVVLGATNLYAISRRWGRPLIERHFAAVLHLTPGRLERAEAWFKRWGILTLIVGRHIPGARVPITIAAGILRVSYPLFALSVAVSTALWGGLFLIVGSAIGDRIGAFLEAHRSTYLLPLALAVVAACYFAIRFGHVRRLRPPNSLADQGPRLRV